MFGKIPRNVAVFSFSLILLSCGIGGDKQTIKTKDGEVTVSDLKKAGEQIQENVDDATRRKEARRKRGDTIAINYKELQKYLPTVAGYEKDGEPDGESINMPGLGSFSKAAQRYKNGDKELEVELLDYNQSDLGFSAATAMLAMNFERENDEEKSGTFNTGITDVRGYEQIYKKEPKCTATYVVANRFVLTLQLYGSNEIAELKTIAKSINLSELASK